MKKKVRITIIQTLIVQSLQQSIRAEMPFIFGYPPIADLVARQMCWPDSGFQLVKSIQTFGYD